MSEGGVPAHRLRPLRGDEQAALYALHEACFRPLVETRFAWDPDQQRRALTGNEGVSWAVEVAGELAGQLILADRGHELFVTRVLVHPRWQGRGLGRRLLEEVIAQAEARGIPVTLSVWENNRARALYARLGFVETEQVEFRVKMRRDPRG
ncbi:MAG: GNAT family N-acetyltransferase [Planctomycetota bacterium]